MMMMMLAKRKLCSTIRSPFPRFFSGSDLKTPNFIVSDYLVASLGLSPDKAARVSKRLTHLNSSDKPDAVLRFLINAGFSESHISKLITLRPELLCSCPEKTLDPNLRALRDMGLSTSAVNQIILSGPQALSKQAAVSIIRFWMDFFDHDEAALVTAFKRNLGLVGHHIGSVSPKISLLRSQGFSNQDIQKIVCKVPRFITGRIGGMEDMLKRTEELGFQPKSGMFLQGLRAMAYSSRDVLHRKMEFLMSFGWSKYDLHSALRKAPSFVTLTEKNMQKKMDFLTGEAMCDLSYVASHPLLLKCSLEKRLRPRLQVMRLLETRGLCQKHRFLYNAICISNSDFAEKYILPHKEIIPELHEEFLRACASGSE